jgi:hypothetical protein
MVEYFDDSHATGKTAFFQVKGKQDSITVKRNGCVMFYDFPVKTLLYAEKFPEPFFLIFLSVTPNEPIYFLWLQKHCQLVLDTSQPEWRNADSVNLEMPVAHDLLQNEATVLRIASHNIMLKMSMQFLSDYFFWERDIESLIEAENLEAKESCLRDINRFISYKDFFYDLDLPDPMLEGLEFQQAINDIMVIRNVHADYEIRESLRRFRDTLKDIVDSILTKPSLEEYLYESIGDLGY